MSNDFCDLTTFMNWWFSNNRPVNIPLDNPVNIYDDFSNDVDAKKITCINLYRSGAYQVQLIVVPPNSTIRQHIHPNMDSYEVYNSGSLEVEVDGIVHGPGACPPIRVLPTSWHGAPKENVLAIEGGSFYSVQKWLNGHLPSCAGADWLGNDGSTKGHAVSSVEQLNKV